MDINKNNAIEDIDGMHISSNLETPIRIGAFDLDDELKVELIEEKFRDILEILGLDLEDDSIKGTPHRIAKMYVKEIFRGLNPKNKPKATMFENKYQYNEMLIEKNIAVYSTCEHHFAPFFGKAHVAYVSNGNVIGLSKINRIVQYYGNRPQLQERLTKQIAKELMEVLNTENVAVLIDATHMCVASRGIKDISSSTITADYNGIFKEDAKKAELFALLGFK